MIHPQGETHIYSNPTTWDKPTHSVHCVTTDGTTCHQQETERLADAGHEGARDALHDQHLEQVADARLLEADPTTHDEFVEHIFDLAVGAAYLMYGDHVDPEDDHAGYCDECLAFGTHLLGCPEALAER